jgi:hypothetical protein
LRRMRIRANRPARSIPQTCLKPRNSKVSGLPSLCRNRVTAANRPKSMHRDFSSASSSPNSANRCRTLCWNWFASCRYWKLTKSSAKRTRYASPRQCRLIFFSNHRSSKNEIEVTQHGRYRSALRSPFFCVDEAFLSVLIDRGYARRTARNGCATGLFRKRLEMV